VSRYDRKRERKVQYRSSDDENWSTEHQAENTTRNPNNPNSTVPVDALGIAKSEKPQRSGIVFTNCHPSSCRPKRIFGLGYIPASASYRSVYDNRVNNGARPDMEIDSQSTDLCSTPLGKKRAFPAKPTRKGGNDSFPSQSTGTLMVQIKFCMYEHDRGLVRQGSRCIRL
jgi:hypothetical protein